MKLLLFRGTPLSSSSNSSQGQDSGKSSTLSAKNGIENIGLAVFKEDRLVGKLNAQETLCHLIVTNELESCNLFIPDPENTNKTIDLFLTLNTPTKIKVYILNGTPYINVDIKVNTRISSIADLYEEISQERIEEIERSAEEYLNKQISAYLYKTSKEFGADAPGTGKYALKHFKTTSEFEDYDWLDKYSDAFFGVNSTVSIKSGFLLTGT